MRSAKNEFEIISNRNICQFVSGGSDPGIEIRHRPLRYRLRSLPAAFEQSQGFLTVDWHFPKFSAAVCGLSTSPFKPRLDFGPISRRTHKRGRKKVLQTVLWSEMLERIRETISAESWIIKSGK
jgi:hypothetical protein